MQSVRAAEGGTVGATRRVVAFFLSKQCNSLFFSCDKPGLDLMQLSLNSDKSWFLGSGT